MSVLIERQDGVLRVTLNRPGAGNAVTPEVIAGLANAVAAAEQSEVRAVLLTGAGTNFCVGADLKYFQDDLPRLSEHLDAMATGFHAMLARLAALPIPVVASVQGNVVGGGLGLMLASDVVVGASDLRLSTGYARLGLSADAGVSLFLTQQLGPRLARSLLLTARTLDAAAARQLGLIDELTEEPLARAAALAHQLSQGPASAHAAIKRLVARAAAGPDLAAHLASEQGEIVRLAAMPAVGAAIGSLLKR